MLSSIAPDEPLGMALKLGKNGQSVTAPIAPGIIEKVFIENMELMAPGKEMDITVTPCVVALDGEREVEIKKGQNAVIRLSTKGPLVVDVCRTMAAAMRNKNFVACV